MKESSLEKVKIRWGIREENMGKRSER